MGWSEMAFWWTGSVCLQVCWIEYIPLYSALLCLHIAMTTAIVCRHSWGLKRLIVQYSIFYCLWPILIFTCMHFCYEIPPCAWVWGIAVWTRWSLLLIVKMLKGPTHLVAIEWSINDPCLTDSRLLCLSKVALQSHCFSWASNFL